MQGQDGSIDRGTLATGIAGLSIATLGLVANAISGSLDLPPIDAPGEEMAAFADRYSTQLAWDVGLRFTILFALFIPFCLGMARHFRDGDEITSWVARIPPIAAVWLVATGGTANTLEAVAVFEHERLADSPEVARLLYVLTSAFFLLTLLPHAAVVGSLSEAGRRTGRLPTWLCVSGYAIVTISFAAVLTMPNSVGNLDSSAPGVLALAAFAGTTLWYLFAGLVLVVAWARQAQRPSALEAAT
jgi:hypothetical protein